MKMNKSTATLPTTPPMMAPMLTPLPELLEFEFGLGLGLGLASTEIDGQ